MVAVAIVAGIGTAIAQDDTDERLSVLEEKVEQMAKRSEHLSHDTWRDIWSA